MRALLWLYPRAWRRHYGAEMEAVLRQMRGRRSLPVALDLVRGAADAHLHPQRPRWRRPRWLPAVLGFVALVAVRFAADWFVLGPAFRLVHVAAVVRIGATVLEAALGGGFALLVLRRTGLPRAMAFAAGCLLELALGGGLSLGVLLDRWLAPALAEALRCVLWAVAIAWLARLRPPRPWHEPPEGAPVSAKPSPHAPEPLSARARRAG
jgi:hypothetical protein